MRLGFGLWLNLEERFAVTVVVVDVDRAEIMQDTGDHISDFMTGTTIADGEDDFFTIVSVVVVDVVGAGSDTANKFIKILCERPRSLGRGGIARQPKVKTGLSLNSLPL